jgi:hypothetical protein
MNTDNSRTQIYEPRPNNAKKRNKSEDQTVLEKSSDEMNCIQIDDEVENEFVAIINLAISSEDAKSMVRRPWKAVEFHEQH